MTTLFEDSRIALSSLRANWFRAALTALGVVIGVASLSWSPPWRGRAVSDSIRRPGRHQGGRRVVRSARASHLRRTITRGHRGDQLSSRSLASSGIEASRGGGENQANTWLGSHVAYSDVQNRGKWKAVATDAMSRPDEA
jgi:hypothetical protein